MNSSNRKSTLPGLTQQSPASQPGRPPQIKPAVAQPKPAAPARGAGRANAPTAYRPQATPQVLQAKRSTPRRASAAQASRAPAAPPVFRPERKGAAQPKTASAAQAYVPPKAAPVCRPQAKPSVQSPTRPVQMKPRQTPPPAQYSRPASKVVQAKTPSGSGIARKGAGVIQRKETFAAVDTGAKAVGAVLRGYVKGAWTKEKCKRLAETVAGCMKNLASRVSIADGGKEVSFRLPGSSYPGSEKGAKDTFEKFFMKLGKDGAWQKPSPGQLAQLYYDLTKGQNLSEANHRGSYLALQVVASAFEVYAPSSDILGTKSQFVKGYLPWFQEPKK